MYHLYIHIQWSSHRHWTNGQYGSWFQVGQPFYAETNFIGPTATVFMKDIRKPTHRNVFFGML